MKTKKSFLPNSTNCGDFTQTFCADKLWLGPQALWQYEKVFECYQEVATTNKHLASLPKPKAKFSRHRTNKQNNYTCGCSTEQFIEVVSTYDGPDSKNEPKVGNKLKQRSTKVQRKKQKALPQNSMASLLSYLSKAGVSRTPPTKPLMPPKQPMVSRPMGNSELDQLKRRNKYLDVLSKVLSQTLTSKQDKPLTKKPASSRSFTSNSSDSLLSPRLRELSKCRLRSLGDVKLSEWKLTNAMRKFKPSERLLQLAKSKRQHSPERREQRIKPSALRHRASHRLEILAQPAPRRVCDLSACMSRNGPFSVSPSALRATASTRILSLAKAKSRVDLKCPINSFSVSPSALTARVTPRLIELARPKHCNPKVISTTH